MARSLFILFILIGSYAGNSGVGAQKPTPEVTVYAGRYSDGRDFAVYFENTKYGLTIRPVLWTATQLLRRTRGDSCEVVDRTSRGADFVRDRSGRLTGVRIRGMDDKGLMLNKAAGPLLPIELFLEGKTADPLIALLKRSYQGH